MIRDSRYDDDSYLGDRNTFEKYRYRYIKQSIAV